MSNFFTNIKDHITKYISWVFISFILWSFLLVNTQYIEPENKLVFYTLGKFADLKGLKNKFNDNLTFPNIKKIFAYDEANNIFNLSGELDGDIYVIREDGISKNLNFFAKFNSNLTYKYKDYELYLNDDNAYGVKVYDHITRKGYGDKFIQYWDEEDENENNYDYFALFNITSIHIGSLNKESIDNYAFELLDYFLTLESVNINNL